MLGTVGSIASLAGAAISLLGLGFAILQLRRLRGETRAARDAAEAAERAVRRDLTISDLASLRENIQEGLHRRERDPAPRPVRGQLQLGLAEATPPHRRKSRQPQAGQMELALTA